MRVVIDTNIFISGIHWKGDPEKVLRAWLQGRFEAVSSLETIVELTRVLRAFKVPMPEKEILWWEGTILEKSTVVEITGSLKIIENDPDDDKFVEMAVVGNAEYIISQDKHLLSLKKYSDIKVLAPKEFLELLS